MWFLETNEIVLTDRTLVWCTLPYPNHPKGCPKYGSGKCAPDLPHITEALDFDEPIYIAFSQFDLGFHERKMKARHPHWTRRQCRNVLYWQGTSRAEMRRRAKLTKTVTQSDTIIECPEGMGVNVYATCFKVGLKLEKIKTLKNCHHVALVGRSL